jgi:acetate kinase
VSTPMRRIRSPCCARTAIGQAAAAPPSSVMKSRRLLISRPESRVVLLVVPTDEELMIAQHTLALLPQQKLRSNASETLAS